MTEKVEKLARLSAAAFWRPEQIDRAFDELPHEQIILALPKEQIQYYLLLAKYAGDDAAKYQAAILLHHAAVDMVEQRKWDVPRGSYIYKNMAAQAINELVNPPRCSECEGRGVKFGKAGLVFSCDSCKGNGMGMITADKRCEMIGFCDQGEWKRKWQPRFDHIYAYGLDQLMSACYHFARRLERAA